MKKQIISLLMAIVLAVSLLPVSVLATETPEEWITVEGIEDGRIIFDADTGTIVDCEPSATKAIIPSKIGDIEVKSIAEYAFSGCTALSSILLPPSITSIGDYAFSGCTSLPSIVIPEGVKRIAAYAFNGCTSLRNITLPESVTYIQEGAFKNCSALVSLTLPMALTGFNSYAFEGCRSLTSITIPSKVTWITVAAFKDCTSLRSVTLPSGITTIWGHAFAGCKSLNEIVLPNSVTTIDTHAFKGCTALASIVIPDKVTTIENNLFEGCTALTEVILPNGLTAIDQLAFYNCTSLTSITLPSSVNSIGNQAFRLCTSLSEITIPSNVTNLGDSLFYGCSKLTTVTVPASITSVGNSVFSNCSKLADIYYDGSKSKWEDLTSGVTGFPLENVIIHCNDGTIDTSVFLITVRSKGGGTVSGGGSFSRGTTATVVAVPNEGYRFTHWDVDGAQISIDSRFEFPVEENMTLNANFEPINKIETYVLTFETGGGSKINSLTVEAGTTVYLGDYLPTWEGYAFCWWYSDKNLTNVISYVTITEDTTVYAKWDAVKYTLIFETNGGSTINALTAAPGAAVSLGQYVPVKEGYAFAGWYADKALTTAVSSVTLSADTTVYAKWDAAKYTLTFETNGGSTINSLPVSSEVTVSLTQYIPTKAGYQFGGWYSDKALTKPVSEIKLTGDVTVYAKWTEQPAVSVFPFTDVKENDWFYGDVKYVYENNLMNGVGDGLFGPGGTTTRGMIVTILYRLEGEPAAALSSFQDVASNMYYAKAVGWAASNGVVNGTSPTTFAPNAPITREQMAAILYRYAQYKGYGVTEQVDLSRFTDAGNISAYAVNAIAWANAKGLINGVGEAQLNPTGQASRSQVAAILHRFCTLIAQ